MPYFKTELCNYYFQQNGKGKTLIFAHGLFVDHTIFSHQFDHLSDFYHCISFDMPGHGNSTFRDTGWTLEEIADDFHEFIRVNSIKKPILIGQSQGGMVFMRLAIKYPDLVGGIILIGTSPKAEYPDRLPFWEEVTHTLSSKNPTQINMLLERIQKNVVSEYFLRNSPSQAVQELRMMQSHNPVALKLSTEAAVLKRTDISAEINRIRCKTLIVCGREDHATPLNLSEIMKEEIKGSRLQTVDNASHHIPIETPEILTNTISLFIETD